MDSEQSVLEILGSNNRDLCYYLQKTKSQRSKKSQMCHSMPAQITEAVYSKHFLALIYDHAEHSKVLQMWVVNGIVGI